jgi:hypothetical protein
VHGRRHQDRTANRQQGGGEQVVGPAGGSPGEQVRGGRRDDHEVGGPGQRDVLDLVDGAEDPGVDGFTRQRLERGGADERQGRDGGDHADAGAALTQQPQEFHGLVRRDPTGDAEQHPGTGHIRAVRLVARHLVVA